MDLLRSIKTATEKHPGALQRELRTTAATLGNEYGAQTIAAAEDIGALTSGLAFGLNNMLGGLDMHYAAPSFGLSTDVARGKLDFTPDGDIVRVGLNSLQM